nr:hypothetical protein [uncultured Pedobacter sp.]
MRETKRSPRRCPPRDDGQDGKAMQKQERPQNKLNVQNIVNLRRQNRKILSLKKT